MTPDPWYRFRLVIAALAVVVVIGSVGYVIIGLTWSDAVYQTVITISTVGYREVGDPDLTGYRPFTIVLIPLGTGLAFYGAAIVIESLLEVRLSEEIRRNRMTRRIEKFEDHVIVCGLGQVGSAITSAITQLGKTVVVIDRGEDSELFGVPVIVGDATRDSVLRDAGIEQASCLVVAMNSDEANVYVTLSGRTLRPDLFIVSRAISAEGSEKLIRAGANRVVNPHELGGTHMAALVAQPNVADFMSVTMHDRELEVQIEELTSHKTSTVGHLGGDGHITVLAIRREEVFMHRPADEFEVIDGDVVIALGTVDDIDRTRQLLA